MTIYQRFIVIILMLFPVSCSAESVNGPKMKPATFTIKRLLDKPIIGPSLSDSIGENIQGPSLIKVPDWIENPLGKYYLYFADHKGTYIRLAYADELTGPWKVHEAGSLKLSESHFLTETPQTSPGLLEQARARVRNVPYPHDIVLDLTTPHIASPDVHIDHDLRKIVMYFHGLQSYAVQLTRVATSANGIDFGGENPILGRPYMRVFQHDNMKYAMSMPGQFYRSKDGFSNFEQGPLLFERNMRHAALLVDGSSLLVFWTRVTDTPERILLSTIDISGDWQTWQESEPIELMRPEREWEGADQPLLPSMRSVAYGQVHQLRDPAIYVEDDRIFLLYAVAGEAGIAIAEVIRN